jgi:hypothetical protein
MKIASDFYVGLFGRALGEYFDFLFGGLFGGL